MGFYLVTIGFTNTSLTGYWTDVIASVLLVSTAWMLVIKQKGEKSWQGQVAKTLTVLSSVVLIGVGGSVLVNPFAWDRFSTTSFHYLRVESRWFHGYFTPVGAYSGGEGNFWITESPQYLPIIETQRFYKHAILWDFSVDEWDGAPVDQKEIVKRHVQKDVIERERHPSRP